MVPAAKAAGQQGVTGKQEMAISRGYVKDGMVGTMAGHLERTDFDAFRSHRRSPFSCFQRALAFRDLDPCRGTGAAAKQRDLGISVQKRAQGADAIAVPMGDQHERYRNMVDVGEHALGGCPRAWTTYSRLGANAQLQWIAGLNVGLPRHAEDQACGRVFPTSMIFGLGHRFTGGWMGIHGAIGNGFAAGREFHVTGLDYGDRPDFAIWTDWQILPGTTPEGLPPHKACEEWIVHSGGWLSAISRWQRRRC